MRINDMTPQILLGQATYNPETRAFEAQAQLFEGGAVFAYHVRHPAVPHCDFDAVTRGLRAQTCAAHQNARARTQRLIRETVRAATSRANSPAVGKYLAV